MMLVPLLGGARGGFLTLVLPTETIQTMNAQSTAAQEYSPFWALSLLIVTLIFLQTWYVVEDFKQRSEIEAARAQLKGLVGQAQTISQTTEAVGRELVVLATHSEEATKIIAEFKIQIDNPGTPAK